MHQEEERKEHKRALRPSKDFFLMLMQSVTNHSHINIFRCCVSYHIGTSFYSKMLQLTVSERKLFEVPQLIQKKRFRHIHTQVVSVSLYIVDPSHNRTYSHPLETQIQLRTQPSDGMGPKNVVLGLGKFQLRLLIGTLFHISVFTFYTISSF